MQLRPLGRSGLRVTPMGLGLAALGRPGYINLSHAEDLDHTYDVEKMEAHTHEVLNAAWDAGIRYFDAARSYGRAEQFLGSWLRKRKISPGAVTVGSKWGYTYTADWQVEADVHEVKEHSIDVLNRQWGETQENLGHQLDLYQIHSATFSSGVLENNTVLNALDQLKENGTAIGLTLSGANQPAVLARALEIETNGVLLFDTVQATWNLLEPSTGPRLAEAHAAGLGVIVKETLANGRLTPKNDHPRFADEYTLLTQQAERLDTTVDALALAAVLAQPWAGVILSGAATVEHLQSNVKALDVAWDEEATETLAGLAEPPEIYWEKRSNLDWN